MQATYDASEGRQTFLGTNLSGQMLTCLLIQAHVPKPAIAVMEEGLGHLHGPPYALPADTATCALESEIARCLLPVDVHSEVTSNLARLSVSRQRPS